MAKYFDDAKGVWVEASAEVAVAKANERAEHWRMKATERGHQLREARLELERIKPLYRRFYHSPFFWFVRPLDEAFDGRTLMRCADPRCGKLFWMDGKSQHTTHLKHQYGRALETGAWDYIKARYLPWLIP